MSDETTGAVDLVKALVANAKRLGLTWSLRPATTSSTQGSTVMSVVLDGDTAEVSAVSLCGFQQDGARVMVMSVPPAGSFVVGRLGTPEPNTSIVSTEGSGWSTNTIRWVVMDGVIHLYVVMTRTGAAIVAGATGNITDNTILTVDDSALLPMWQVHTSFRATVTGGSAQVTTGGAVQIVDMHSLSTISTGDTVRVNVTYPVTGGFA